MNKLRTVLLFGGSGRTGVHVTRRLLREGYAVRLFARSPEKVELQHENLELFQGDMTSESDVERACSGIDKVICVAGGPMYKWRRYPIGFMDQFVGYLIQGMRTNGIKRFVYQAGAVNPFPGEKVAFSNKLLRFALALFLGIRGNEEDNDLVIVRLSNAEDLDWTVTRPNYMLGNKHSKKMIGLRMDKLPPYHSFILSFATVADWTVDVMDNENTIRRFPSPSKTDEKRTR